MLDTTFITTISYPGSDAFITDMEIDTQNRIIIGGHFKTVNNTSRSCIARLLPLDGTNDQCFDPGTGLGHSNAGSENIDSLSLDINNNIFISGWFTDYNGTPRTDLARIINNSTANNAVAQNDNLGTLAIPATITTLGNILSNDTLDAQPATTANVTFTSTPTAHLSIDATGAVKLAAQTPPGTYTLPYTLCPQNLNCGCSTGQVSVTVISAVEGIDDEYVVDVCSGPGPRRNVVTNDLYLGYFGANSSTVTVTTISTTHPGIIVSPTGGISINTSAPGTYTVIYQICSKINSQDCDTASLTVVIESCITPGIRAGRGVWASGIQSNGNIIIGGGFGTYNNIPANNIAGLYNTLQLNPGFVTSGPSGTRINNIDILSDDSIIVSGSFTSFNNVDTPDNLVKLDSNGNLVSFNTGGTGFGGTIDSKIEGVGLLSGKIVAVGNFSTYNGITQNHITCLNSNGSINATFYTGSGFNAYCTAVIVNNNKVLVGGTFNNYNGTTVHTLIRLDKFGSIDPLFQQKSFTYSNINHIKTIAIQPSNNYILVGGQFTHYDGITRNNIVRLLGDGGIDTSFDPGTGFNGAVEKILVQPDGYIIVGGDFTVYDGQPVNYLVRLEPDGDLDTTFNIGSGPDAAVLTMTRQSDGKIVVGGHFYNFDNQYAGYITRIDPSTGSQNRGGAINNFSKDEIIKSFESFTIYPNPSTGIFNLDMSGFETEKFELTIFNPLGQLIYQNTVSKDTANQIDLSSFKSGNYFVRLQNNQRTINKIITKN